MQSAFGPRIACRLLQRGEVSCCVMCYGAHQAPPLRMHPCFMLDTAIMELSPGMAVRCSGLAKLLQNAASEKGKGRTVPAFVTHARVMTPSAWDRNQDHSNVQELLEYHFQVRTSEPQPKSLHSPFSMVCSAARCTLWNICSSAVKRSPS